MSLKSLARSLLPRRIAPHCILAGPLRGSHIVTSWHDYPAAITGRTERKLLDWFAGNVRPGETWLDIGAHYGYTSIALSRLVGADGRVFAFEPMISTAGYLEQTRLMNQLRQLTVMPIALGAGAALGLKRLPTVRGMVDSTGQGGDWDETVLVASLDQFWPAICGENDRIHGIKVDVQGMEVQVLSGMSELLSRQRPRLVVELHHGVARNELVNLVWVAGYVARGIPIEPMEGEREPRYCDDRSYAFQAA